jgi:WD domain, G-beta repeat
LPESEVGYINGEKKAEVPAVMLVDSLTIEPARQAAVERKDECERTVQQLEVQLAEQQEQLEDMRVKLAQINATRGNLRAQRDALEARLKLARARVQQDGGRPIWRRRAVLIVAALALGGVTLAAIGVAYAVRWFWQTGEAVVATLGGSAASAGAETLLNQGYDPETKQPRAQAWPPSDESDSGPAEVPLRQLIGHRGGVGGVAFNHQGTLLVSAGSDGTLRFWDPSTGRQVKQLSEDLWRGLGAVAFSRDDRLVATSTVRDYGVKQSLTIWGVATGEIQHRLLEGGFSNTFAFRPGERTLAVLVQGTELPSLGIWNIDTGERVGEIATGEHTVGAGGADS